MFLRFGDDFEGFPVQRAAVAAAGGVSVMREVSESLRKGYGGEFGCGEATNLWRRPWLFLGALLCVRGFRWFSVVFRG